MNRDEGVSDNLANFNPLLNYMLLSSQKPKSVLAMSEWTHRAL